MCKDVFVFYPNFCILFEYACINEVCWVLSFSWLWFYLFICIGIYKGFLILHRKPAELLEIDLVLRDQVPVIKRFTGGGTVTVDHGTIFVTFICNRDAVPGLQLYPRPIMSWSSQLYSRVFEGFGDFHLRENGTLMNPSLTYS